MNNIAKAFPDHYDALLKDVVVSLRHIAPELTPHLPSHDEPSPPQVQQEQPSTKPR